MYIQERVCLVIVNSSRFYNGLGGQSCLNVLLCGSQFVGSGPAASSFTPHVEDRCRLHAPADGTTYTAIQQTHLSSAG
eukprot:scaffold30359_cov59-Phaeocystis_antarctica.AAC.1